MSIDAEWEQVKTFHQTFHHPHRDKPETISKDRAVARANWMKEEVDEFLQAKTLVDQADAMIDLIYFALGTLVEMGIKPAPLFAIVHSANMNKLWPDGNARFDSSGKVIKPDAWEDPHIAIARVLQVELSSKC